MSMFFLALGMSGVYEGGTSGATTPLSGGVECLSAETRGVLSGCMKGVRVVRQRPCRGAWSVCRPRRVECSWRGIRGLARGLSTTTGRKYSLLRFGFSGGVPVCRRHGLGLEFRSIQTTTADTTEVPCVGVHYLSTGGGFSRVDVMPLKTVLLRS